MADEIDLYAGLKLDNGSISLSREIAFGTITPDQTTASYHAGVQTVGFAAHEAIELGDVSACGYSMFINTDATNFVEIGIDVGSTFYPFVKLLAGEVSGPLRLGTNAPYAKADTGDVLLEYIILST